MNGFKWSEVPQKQQWLIAWGVWWRIAVVTLAVWVVFFMVALAVSVGAGA